MRRVSRSVKRTARLVRPSANPGTCQLSHRKIDRFLPGTFGATSLNVPQQTKDLGDEYADD
jgi:hypothetical protein